MTKRILTREIPLTQGKIAIVNAGDFAWLSQWKWYALRRKRGRNDEWYAMRKEGPRKALRTIAMHRLIAGASNGEDVDHKNGNGLDNRRRNLRRATRRQNLQNNRRLRAIKSSRFRGVWRDRHRKAWAAQIRAGAIGADGQSAKVFLGRFANEHDAARAYDAAVRAYRGKWTGTLNFPKGGRKR